MVNLTDMINFDYSSTTPVDESLLKVFCEVSKNEIGHPGTISPAGKSAAKILDDARDLILTSLNLTGYKAIFTSSGTETNNLAIIGLAKRFKTKKHFITSNIEHSSVRSAFQFLETEGHTVTYLPVDMYGQIDLEELRLSLTKDTVLVSIITVNNEVGTISKLQAIKQIVRANSTALLMTDFIQGIGKVDCSIINDFDLIAISAHKIYAPKGNATLIFKKSVIFEPLLIGGTGEFGLRPGMPNIAGIVCLAIAIEKTIKQYNQDVIKVTKLRDYLNEQLMSFDNIRFSVDQTKTVPYIVSLIVSKLNSEVLVNAFAEHNIIISTMSACAVKSGKGSHVLAAILNDENASYHGLRICLSKKTTITEIDQLIFALKEILNENK